MTTLRFYAVAFARFRWQIALLSGVAALVVGPWVIAAQSVVLVDLIDAPSRIQNSQPHSMVSGVASLEGRTIAVGPRGLIMLSEDSGRSWRQVSTPVSTDLVTVKFSGPNVVWAVGHDAVALKSIDGGDTWKRLLDGRAVLRLLRETAKGSDQLEAEIERTMGQSATADVWPAPLLDIRFAADGQTGFAVGGFGLILHTTDGGENWQAWKGKADNEQRYHLYALTGEDDAIFVAGEQGLVMRFDAQSQSFKKVPTPYNGSFFGIEQLGKKLVAFGLRGNAFVSEDAGLKWRKIETEVDANLVAAVAFDDTVLLVSQQGEVRRVDFKTARTSAYDQASGGEVYGAAMTQSHRLALARSSGVGVMAFSPQSN